MTLLLPESEKEEKCVLILWEAEEEKSVLMLWEEEEEEEGAVSSRSSFPAEQCTLENILIQPLSDHDWDWSNAFAFAKALKNYGYNLL